MSLGDVERRTFTDVDRHELADWCTLQCKDLNEDECVDEIDGTNLYEASKTKRIVRTTPKGRPDLPRCYQEDSLIRWYRFQKDAGNKYLTDPFTCENLKSPSEWKAYPNKAERKCFSKLQRYELYAKIAGEEEYKHGPWPERQSLRNTLWGIYDTFRDINLGRIKKKKRTWDKLTNEWRNFFRVPLLRLVYLQLLVSIGSDYNLKEHNFTSWKSITDEIASIREHISVFEEAKARYEFAIVGPDEQAQKLYEEEERRDVEEAKQHAIDYFQATEVYMAHAAPIDDDANEHSRCTVQ
jgi:hypothetical protein